VPSEVLESAAHKPSPQNGGSTSEVRSNEGSPEVRKTEPQIKQEATSPTPPEDDAAPAEQKPRKQQAVPTPAGGSTARGLTERPQAQPGAAGASPGEISRYAMAVRAALARSKPRGTREIGTVTISFAIGPRGEVHFARVSGSSGRAALDEATLTAVKRTTFPVPPAGMSVDQLTYVVPFRFK